MKKNLSIAFFGSSLASAYWNGAATYYRGLCKALHGRGHSIRFYEPDAYERQKHRDLEDFSYAQDIVYPATEAGVRDALANAAGADIIVKASGVGVFDELLEQAVLDLKKPRNAVLFWDVDAPATLERVLGNPADPFRALIPQYDAVLTYGGGEPVIKAYGTLFARRCVPVYNALDPDTHFPADPHAKFKAHLSFLGNRMPDRESRVKEFFFKPAALLPRFRFALGGNGWDANVPKLSNVVYHGHVYTYDHNSFNCSTRAVLNIDRQSMATFGYSPPTRIFEAAGAGACIITDAWEGIEMFLSPGQECLTASDGNEVVTILETLTDRQARAIGQAGRKRVLAEHTYEHRARQVEEILYGTLNPGERA
jgi:spore maturation protein CgeB